ncbi:hypothetical protein CBR_g51052 [Chara braunii]|uniref:Sfi1 spindle body domain-containing protein n=1 Tax=Chara braunii TaxID=69332 RepID=A0A388K5Y2_CHABU|nr:hypothetical protein CBR_g51052 [Chara braunii]|eukprot:GBG65457.1 hypothetical protein CBR_g51052 [Chara braunii]
MMTAVMNGWIDFICMVKRTRELRLRAARFWRCWLVNLAMRAWKWQLARLKQKRADLQHVQHWKTRRMTQSVMTSWGARIAKSRFKRTQRRNCGTFRRRKLLAKSLAGWQMDAEVKRATSEIMRLIAWRCCRAVAIRLLAEWKALVHNNRRLTVAALKVEDGSRHRAKRTALDAWKRYVEGQRKNRQLRETAAACLGTRTKRMSLGALASNLRRGRRKKLAMAVGRKAMEKKALRFWQVWATFQARERAKIWTLLKKVLVREKANIFREWRELMKVHSRDRAVLKLLGQKAKDRALRQATEEWRNRVALERKRREWMLRAGKNRQLTLRREVMMAWHDETRERHHLRQLMNHLADFYRRAELRNAFDAWLCWASLMRKLHEMEEKRHRDAVRMFLQEWQMLTRQRRSLNERITRLVGRRQTSTLSRAMKSWLDVSLTKMAMKERIAILAEVIKRADMERVLGEWLRVVLEGKREREGKVLASRFHAHKIKRSAFDGWRRLYLLSKEASRRRKHALESRSWGAWASYTRRKRQAFIGRRLWEDRTIGRCVKVWHRWARERRSREDLIARALAVKLERAVAQLLTSWREWALRKKERQKREAQAFLFWQERERERALKRWSTNVKEKKEEESKESKAIKFWKVRSAELCAKKWKQWLIKRKREEQLFRRALQLWQEAKLSRSFRLMLDYARGWTSRKKELSQKEKEAGALWLKTCAKEVLDRWLHFAGEKRRRDAHKEAAMKFRKEKLVQWRSKMSKDCLMCWCDFVSNKQAREADMEAIKWYIASCRLQSAFDHWRRGSRRRTEVAKLVTNCRTARKRRLLAEIFHAWKTWAHHQHDTKAKEGKVSGKLRKRIYKDVLHGWQAVVIDSKKTREKERMARKWRESLCLLRSTVEWRNSIMNRARKRQAIEGFTRTRDLKKLRELMKEWKAVADCSRRRREIITHAVTRWTKHFLAAAMSGWRTSTLYPFSKSLSRAFKF